MFPSDFYFHFFNLNKCTANHIFKAFTNNFSALHIPEHIQIHVLFSTHNSTCEIGQVDIPISILQQKKLKIREGTFLMLHSYRVPTL